jgi:arginase family enzyme
MSIVHFIKAPCHQSNRKQGYQFGADDIKKIYDYDIDINLFSGTIIDSIKGHKICKGYTTLHKYIYEYVLKNQNDKIITIGGDHSISASTISAINEVYINKNKVSDLKVIWFDIFPDIHNFISSNTKNLNDMAMSSLLGQCDPPFVKHTPIKPEQIMCIGLQKTSDLDILDEYGIKYITIDKIKQIGVESILPIINMFVGDSPVHISLDMKVFDESFAPSTERYSKEGLMLNDITKIINKIKQNVVALDLTEYNPYIGGPTDSKKTREVARQVLIDTFDVKQNSINIFNENSEFLIYRPSAKKDTDTDYGWYFLANMSMEQRNEIMKELDKDSIMPIKIDDEYYLITKTTMDEQNNKSYYTCNAIRDTVMFPEEKKSMCFELLNSN